MEGKQILSPKRPKVFAVSGIKNSGKTTLINRLVIALIDKGYKVGVIKHTEHEFEINQPETDSSKHKLAGAQNVIVYSHNQLMMVQDIQNADIYELIKLQKDMDIIILEGMKYSNFPKIEVVRQTISQEIVCNPKTLLAVVTDTKIKLHDIPIIALNDLNSILEIVLKYINNI